eukprot:TRINITY_DN670_c0_g1_i4.p1 TRINITY_DN670_c0_g1~~TRINITY_DN670_c0_g1_i4.p1  ORF type:complete len:1340 (+),score=352.30 TRINITY_DN670_c0_g1_i4:70-4089(+)
MELGKENPIPICETFSPSFRQKKFLQGERKALTPLKAPGTRGLASQLPPPTTWSVSHVTEKPLTAPTSDVIVAELKEFAERPFVDFGEVTIGKTISRVVRLVNKGIILETIRVAKTPKPAAGFLITSDDLCVHPQSHFDLTINWNPQSAGGHREVVLLKWSERGMLSVVLYGTAKEKKAMKTKKRSSSMLSSSFVTQTPQTASRTVKLQLDTKRYRDGSQSGMTDHSRPQKIRRVCAEQDSVSSLGIIPVQKLDLSISTSSAEVQKKPSAKTFKKKDRSAKTSMKTFVTRSNPARFRNVFQEDGWIEKQERGFTRWINHLLGQDDHNLKFGDMEKVNFESQKKWMVSLHKAASLFQADESIEIARRVENEIMSERLAMSDAVNVHFDVGKRGALLNIILSYNHTWLQLGLETMFNGLFPKSSLQKRSQMEEIVQSCILVPPNLPDDTYMGDEGVVASIRKHLLKHFILLVHLLDRCKKENVIADNPCLFRNDAMIKSSENVLKEFSKLCLQSEGDLVRRLRHLGLTCDVQQTALDEYDLRVNHISVDLRDGVRLCKMAEVLCGTSLSENMKVPATTKLNKLHNVQLALKAFDDHLSTKRGKKVTRFEGLAHFSELIAAGTRDQTLMALWKIAFSFNIPSLVDIKELEYEIKRLRSPHFAKPTSFEDDGKEEKEEKGRGEEKLAGTCLLEENLNTFFISGTTDLLLQWCTAVCEKYELPVQNFTVSFADGRAFCLLVHHYQPNVLPLDEVCLEMPASESIDKLVHPGDRSCGEGGWSCTFSPSSIKLKAKVTEKKMQNFRLLQQKLEQLGGIPYLIRATEMVDTIPDEKIVITFTSYIFSRLMGLRKFTSAASAIQKWWRKNQPNRKQSVLSIERFWQTCLARKSFMRLREKIVKIQTTWRKHHAVVEYSSLRSSVIAVQTLVRGYLCRRSYLLCRSSAIKIQSCVRRMIAMNLLKREIAARRVQSVYRGYVARKSFMRLREKIVKIQTTWRKHHAVVEYSSLRSSVIAVQTLVRGYLCRRSYLLCRSSAIKIQSCVRRMIAINLIERLWNARRMHERYESSALIVQRVVRGYLCRVDFLRVKSLVVFLQMHYRSMETRRRFVQYRRSVIVVQSLIRRFLVLRHMQAHEAELNVIRRKIRRANALARPEDSLASRTNNAVEVLLDSTKLAFVMKACANLDVTTKWSKECRGQLHRDGAIVAIIKLMQSCNRSQPHVELLLHILNVIHHLVEDANTVDAVLDAPESVETLVDVLQMFRDRDAVVLKVLQTIQCLLLDDERLIIIRDLSESIKRMESIHSVLSRKLSMEKKMQTRGVKKTSDGVPLSKIVQIFGHILKKLKL